MEVSELAKKIRVRYSPHPLYQVEPRPALEQNDAQKLNNEKHRALAEILSSPPKDPKKQISPQNLDLDQDRFLAKAEFAKDFLAGLNESKEKEFLKDLFAQKEFLEFISKPFADIDSRKLTRSLVGDENLNAEKLNSMLLDLFLKMHLQTGTHFQPLIFSFENDVKKTAFLIKQDTSVNLFSDKEVRIDERKPNLDNALLDAFKGILNGEVVYYSSFAKKIKNIAFLTKDRSQAMNNLCEFLNNFIRYGHCAKGPQEQKLKIYVLDDSDKEFAAVNKMKIDNEINPLFSDYVDIVYVGEDEKQKLIQGVIDKARASSTILVPDFEEGARAALAHQSGPGAQRNIAHLLNALEIDDDVHPYAVTDINSEAKTAPVDVLSVMARSLSEEGTHCSSIYYCGKKGAPYYSSIINFLDAENQEKFRIIEQNYHVDINAYGQFSYPYFFVAPNSSTGDLSGGITGKSDILAGEGQDSFSLPAVTNKDRYLRIEDNLNQGVVLKFKSQFNHPRNLQFQPATSIYHEPTVIDTSDSVRLDRIIEQAFVENFARHVFDFILTNLISLQKASKIADINLEQIGVNLEKVIQDQNFDKFMQLVIGDQNESGGIYEHIIGPMVMLAETQDKLEKSGELKRNLPKQNVFKALDKFYEKYGLKDIYARLKKKELDFHLSEFDLSKLFGLLKPELGHYAKALKAWEQIKTLSTPT